MYICNPATWCRKVLSLYHMNFCLAMPALKFNFFKVLVWFFRKTNIIKNSYFHWGFFLSPKSLHVKNFLQIEWLLKQLTLKMEKFLPHKFAYLSKINPERLRIETSWWNQMDFSIKGSNLLRIMAPSGHRNIVSELFGFLQGPA